MKKINTTFRSEAAELMDDFQLEGEELKEALDKIAKINQLLGGNKLTLHGVSLLLKKVSKSTAVTIADVGCGNGDMLRYIADFGVKNNLNLKLIGIDANAFTIKHAQSLSHKYNNIEYVTENIFDKPFIELKYDIILSTLTLHHFKEKEIIYLMSVFYKNAAIGIVINDLHRSKLAYRLFEVVCSIFNLNKMSREDGLTSILRGFKKPELVNYSNQLNFKKYTLFWKWAFRFEWIIYKT